MAFQTDIVVVGGGPTGLLLACELALVGVRVTVLERRPDGVGQTRALGMQARSIEVLELRGIADRFLQRGMSHPAGHYAGLETRLDMSAMDTTFPCVLAIPQIITEELLQARALELGVDLRRGWKVVTAEETADGVRVSGTTKDGEAFEVEGRYLVGADGARSIVRDQIGVAFPGKDADLIFYFGDVAMTGAPFEGSFSKRNEEGAVVAAFVGDGRYRLVFIDPTRFHVPVSTPVTLEEMQDGARRIISPDAVVSDPFWLSRFGNETRLAERYRRGRVFLAGDAAHIHLPAGGQGMNTGLQDAVNLGWKLGGVIRGLAPESLLGTYEPERRPVGEQLIENTLAQSAIMAAFGPEGVALRATMERLLAIPAVNRQLAGALSALEIHYPDPLVDGFDAGPAEWVGRRLADARLQLADGSQTSLFSMLHKGDWVDLRFDGGPPSPLPSGIAPGWVRSESVTLLDQGSSLNPLSRILVRPDGHAASAKLAA